MSNNKLQYFTSGTAFLLSSQVLFNPIYSSRHKLFVCIAVLIFVPALAYVYSKLYVGFSVREKKIGLQNLIFCVPAALFFCFCAAFCLYTFSSGLKPYSQFYSSNEYIAVLCGVLVVICVICSHINNNGLFRFCSLTALLFVLYFLIMYFGLFSISREILPQSPDIGAVSIQSFEDSVASVIILFSDISAFLFVFSDKKASHGQNITITLFAIFIALTNVFRTSLMTGSYFSSITSNPDLISIKLIPGFDFPEICILVTGFAAIIKASVYLHGALKLIKLCFHEKASDERIFSIASGVITFLLCLALLGKDFTSFSSLRFFEYILLLSGLFPIFILSFVSKRKK